MTLHHDAAPPRAVVDHATQHSLPPRAELCTTDIPADCHDRYQRAPVWLLFTLLVPNQLPQRLNVNHDLQDVPGVSPSGRHRVNSTRNEFECPWRWGLPSIPRIAIQDDFIGGNEIPWTQRGRR